MKTKIKNRIVSVLVAGAMAVVALPLAPIQAAGAGTTTGKYVSDVFIAYGKDETAAKKWLTDNGWEPIKGDLNAGKNSQNDDPVAAVMGIRRTDDPNQAVTDMAIMNMGSEGNRGYSFDDYQELLAEKKTDIDEFVDSFMPVVREYRENYNSAEGSPRKLRANLAYELMNKFYDGEVDGNYAVNDTGMLLGDLFLHETRRELGEEKHDALDKNTRIQYGDLQQIILEGSGAILFAVETALALASDSDDSTWLQRLSSVSGMDMADAAELFIDDAASRTHGNPATARSLMLSTYGDAAALLAADYNSIQQEMIWYETYLDNNGLRKGDDESDEDYGARIDAFFDDLQANNEARYNEEWNHYRNTSLTNDILYNVEYEGEWGATLGDFFYPLDEGLNYQDNVDAFLPLAASLSPGQRSGINFLSLRTLLMVGSGDPERISDVLPDVEPLLEGVPSISVYSGINRAIFRDGVALTNQAMVQKGLGRSPYDQMYGPGGTKACQIFAAFVLGCVMTFAGGMSLFVTSSNVSRYKAAVQSVKNECLVTKTAVGESTEGSKIYEIGEMYEDMDTYTSESLTRDTDYYSSKILPNKIGAAVSAVLMCIGIAMIVYSMVTRVKALSKYYHREFSVIPSYIVEESDIVEYLTDANGNPILDENGNQKRNITFDQYVFYKVVKCNRQDIGVNDEAQGGVDEYAEWGCGDAADINADIGIQWLALYTVKSPKKGNPIIADTIRVIYGDSPVPRKCTEKLHFFTYTNAADLSDTAYAFNHGKGGIKVYWGADTAAFTASAFTAGQIALVSIGCLALGIVGGTATVKLTGKRKETPEAPAVA